VPELRIQDPCPWHCAPPWTARALCLTDFQKSSGSPEPQTRSTSESCCPDTCFDTCVTLRRFTPIVKHLVPQTANAQDHHDCRAAHEEEMPGGGLRQ
jgi:hypothetical protein